MNEAQRSLALYHALKLIGNLTGLRHDGEVVITATLTENLVGFGCIINGERVWITFNDDYSVSASIGNKYENVGVWGAHCQHMNIATFVGRVKEQRAKDEQFCQTD